MEDPVTLADVKRLDLTLWAFCLMCGRSHLLDPHQMPKGANVAADRLDEIAKKFKCHNCGSQFSRLIPTPRTMVSFTKMT